MAEEEIRSLLLNYVDVQSVLMVDFSCPLRSKPFRHNNAHSGSFRVVAAATTAFEKH